MSCGRCSRASSSAAKPSVATVASWPACLTIRRASSRLFGSSSTTRIFAIPRLRSGLVRGEREVDGEGRPEPETDAARGDGAAVRLDDEASDVKTEPDSDLVLRGWGLHPAVLPEDHSKMRPRKTDALVLHQDARSVLALPHRDVDRRFRRRKAERVVEDVLDRGPQTLGIRIDPYRVGFRHELQAIALSLLDQRRDELGKVESAAIQPEASRFELPDLEDVVGESFEVAALPAKLIDRAALRRREGGCPREIRDSRLDLTRGPPQGVRDQSERLLAMRIDAPQRGAFATYLIDQKREHQKDRRTRKSVPHARRQQDRRTRDQVGPDPRPRREESNEHGGSAPEPPAREPDGDEIEDREAEIGSGRDVHEPDRGHTCRCDEGERHDPATAPYVDVGDAVRDGLRSQGRGPLTHPAAV